MQRCLLIHENGRWGDFVLLRRLFEPLATKYQNLTVAIPPEYWPAIASPFVTSIQNSYTVNAEDFDLVFSVGSTIRYLWPAKCGVKYPDHSNTYLPIGPTEHRPDILLCPKSVDPSRSLRRGHIDAIATALGPRLTALHTEAIEGVPTVTGRDFPNWCGILNNARLILTVDTGSFHLACQLTKPVLLLSTNRELPNYYSPRPSSIHHDSRFEITKLMEWVTQQSG